MLAGLVRDIFIVNIDNFRLLKHLNNARRNRIRWMFDLLILEIIWLE